MVWSLNDGNKVGGLLFADDFVSISDSKEDLQRLIDVVYRFCYRWRLRANVSKSAVMVFSKVMVKGDWMWRKHTHQKYLVILT